VGIREKSILVRLVSGKVMDKIVEYWEILTFTGVSAAWLANELRKWKVTRKKKRYHGLDKNLAIDGEIYEILWSLLVKYRAMRVFIVQFHNGSSYYTGQSIQRMTVSHEVTFPGQLISKVKINNDNILISEMDHRILTDIKKGDQYCVRDVDAIRDGMYTEAIADWMDVYSAKSMYNIRIIDKKTQETVATLNLHFDSKDPLEDFEVGELMETKKRIEAIFDRL
jgi:hypoxanthine-guanine phosphoribosyltransferase